MDVRPRGVCGVLHAARRALVSMAALSALSRLLEATGRPSPSSPQPPGLGAAHSRLDWNRGEHHADGTYVTIAHPACDAATAGGGRNTKSLRG